MPSIARGRLPSHATRSADHVSQSHAKARALRRRQRVRHSLEKMNSPTSSLRRLHAPNDTQIDEFADILIDCVEGDASVSFMHPLTRERAVAFWRRVARGVAAGERALLVAEDSQGLCGAVQLLLDQDENQPHRADSNGVVASRRASLFSKSLSAGNTQTKTRHNLLRGWGLASRTPGSQRHWQPGAMRHNALGVEERRAGERAEGAEKSGRKFEMREDSQFRSMDLRSVRPPVVPTGGPELRSGRPPAAQTTSLCYRPPRGRFGNAKGVQAHSPRLPSSPTLVNPSHTAPTPTELWREGEHGCFKNPCAHGGTRLKQRLAIDLDSCHSTLSCSIFPP
jgi:hypothetical protein